VETKGLTKVELRSCELTGGQASGKSTEHILLEYCLLHSLDSAFIYLQSICPPKSLCDVISLLILDN